MGADAARRTVLAAQGFAAQGLTAQGSTAQGFADRGLADRSAPAHRGHLRRALDRLKLLQLDSVNVAVRAHYMPLYSRIGQYRGELLDDAAWQHSSRKPRLLVEYWAHEASLIPVADWPLLRWRMRENAASPRGWNGRLRQEAPGLLADVLEVVKDQGPIGAGALERELGAERGARRGPWWDRSPTKRAAEVLFAAGELTTRTRRGFERLYDLPERVLPRDVLAADPDEHEAVRGLVERAADALGVATEPDLRDYYRLAPARSRRAVAELVEAGVLEPVAVQGWRDRAYRHVAARTPRSVRGRALLSPFDPLVWDRARAERLFGFRYRIEIYVPESRREHGYYVLPFLLDGQLVGRVDLKADRKSGVLRVPGAFLEPGQDASRVVAELAESLRDVAGWLGLGGIEVGDRGDLADALRAVCT